MKGISIHIDEMVFDNTYCNPAFRFGLEPEKYAGWAAVDATPQESSNGMMQCGPAPLKVIFYFTSL